MLRCQPACCADLERLSDYDLHARNQPRRAQITGLCSYLSNGAVELIFDVFWLFAICSFALDRSVFTAECLALVTLFLELVHDQGPGRTCWRACRSLPQRLIFEFEYAAVRIALTIIRPSLCVFEYSLLSPPPAAVDMAASTILYPPFPVRMRPAILTLSKLLLQACAYNSILPEHLLLRCTEACSPCLVLAQSSAVFT